MTYRIIHTELTSQGFLTYVEHYKYPMRACPQESNLHHVDTLKRILIASSRFIYKIPFIFYKLEKIKEEIARWMSDLYWADVPTRDRNRFPDQEYSQTTREIIRVLNLLNPYKFLEFAQEKAGWVYYIAAIWETDLAYRFRGQDILSLLNKENLQISPKKEIMRLVNIALEREIGGVTPKLILLKKLLKVALIFPAFMNPIKNFLEEVNLDEIKLDINDRYWCANRFDYNYEGKTYEERSQWKEEEDKNWKRPIIPETPVQLALYPPTEKFYSLSEDIANEMAENAKIAIMNNWRQNHVETT